MFYSTSSRKPLKTLHSPYLRSRWKMAGYWVLETLSSRSGRVSWITSSEDAKLDCKSHTISLYPTDPSTNPPPCTHLPNKTTSISRPRNQFTKFWKIMTMTKSIPSLASGLCCLVIERLPTALQWTEIFSTQKWKELTVFSVFTEMQFENASFMGPPTLRSSSITSMVTVRSSLKTATSRSSSTPSCWF